MGKGFFWGVIIEICTWRLQGSNFRTDWLTVFALTFTIGVHGLQSRGDSFAVFGEAVGCYSSAHSIILWWICWQRSRLQLGPCKSLLLPCSWKRGRENFKLLVKECTCPQKTELRNSLQEHGHTFALTITLSKSLLPRHVRETLHLPPTGGLRRSNE